jgi:hypothetical protein
MIAGLRLQTQEIGRIKIGEQTDDASNPKILDYFRITGSTRDGSKNFVTDPILKKKLGAKPIELDIILPSDDIEKCFLTRYALYAGGERICWGDGIKATRIEADGPKTIQCDVETCEYLKGPGKQIETTFYRCKPSGILLVRLAKAMRVGGIYTFRTHSWYSIKGILSSLVDISRITSGVIEGIPLRLKIRPQTIEADGKSRLIYIVNVEYAGSAESLRKKATEIARTRDRSARSIERSLSMLRDQVLNSEDTADVNSEFSPATAGKASPFKTKTKLVRDNLF